MGAYDSNPTPPWNPNSNEVDRIGGLNEQFLGLGVSESSEGSSIYQVMKAVEDAESTIKQQMEEKQQLKDQLLWHKRELEKYKLESQRSSAVVTREGHAMGAYKAHSSQIPGGTEAEQVRLMDHNSLTNSHGTLVIHQNGTPEIDSPLQTITRNQQYSESTKVNGSLKMSPVAQIGVDSAGLSQLSTPSSRSLSPTRHRKEGEYDSTRFNSSGQGLIPVSETSSNNLWKQDLSIKVREREEEIAMLRKHLADYSLKEAQIHNEKYVLDKRIAYMRMAFDQQQQDLVDAGSKALSYRQDIIEENVRLTYALQASQQERSTFISSLLPLLTEYNLQPSVHDAQSIVSNLKVLFKHLQEKLILTEDKLKESQYQLAPWHAELSNNTNFTLQSPSHSFGAAVANSSKSLEIVLQPAYSYARTPVPSHSTAQTNFEWDALGNQNHPGSRLHAAKNSDQDGLERTPLSLSRFILIPVWWECFGAAVPNLQRLAIRILSLTCSSSGVRGIGVLSSKNTMAHENSAPVAQSDPHVVRFSAESKDQNPSFKDLVRGNEIDDPEPTGLQHGRELTVHWGPGSAPCLSSGLDDPNASYPYLPPVLEEPGSSFSEAAEDDPLPGIVGLQISGEAFPGREIQACGYSINGTTSCNFEWVRYLEDGSVNYIEGAKQPNYLVTADDVDSYLAIEVHPLDDKKRKGELVKVFANERRRITCDLEMQEQIERTLSIGHNSYEVLLSAKYLDIWEQAVLAIKKEGYSIKCNGPRGVVVTEKFLPDTYILIPLLPYGRPTEFSIQCANGDEYLLRAKDSSWLRDTIVLTMRLFRKMALEKRKGRKKGLFFKS